MLVLVLAFAALPLLPGIAQAHHAEVAASIDCGSVVTFTAEAWAGQGTPGSQPWIDSRTNGDVHVWYTVDGGGPTLVVGDGQFNQGNTFRFAGQFQAPATGTIRVYAQAQANWANGGGPGGSSTTGALVRPTSCGDPDVRVSKSAGKSGVVPGETFDYTLVAENVGTASAAAVQIQDQIPAGLQIVAVPGTCSAAGNTVSCTVGTLAAGASASVSITVQATVAACPKADNTGTVSSSNEPAANTGNNTSNTVTVNVECEPDVVISKSASTTSVAPGDRFDYTLEAESVGNTAATDVRIEDRIPAGLQIVAVPGNCTVAGQNVSCDIGTLAPGAIGSVTFTVEATTGACPKVENIGTVTASNEPAGNTYDNTSGTVSVDVACKPDVVISKSASASSVAPGDRFDYTLEARSVGNTAATDVRIEDRIPAALTIVGLPGTCSAAGNHVTCDLGTLPPGSTGSVTITVEASNAACPKVDNTGTVSSSNEPAANTANNTSNTVTVNVSCDQPDVQVVKSAGSAQVDAGGSVTFTIQASNTGRATATAVVIQDAVPPGLQITAASAGCVVNGQTVTCGVGDLGPGQSVSVTITVIATDGACPEVTNQASVSATNEPAGLAGNNLSNPVALSVICPTPDVEIRKRSGAPPAGVSPGDEFTYTIAVENVSGGAVNDVVVTDRIPDGLQIVSASSGCTVAGQTVTCGLGTVAAGATVHVTIIVRATEDACPQVTNRATLTASNDGNPGNDASAAVTDLVNCEEPGIAVRIDKTNDADGDGRYTDLEEARRAGLDVPFRLVVTNTGDAPWTITTLTDAFEQEVVDLLDGPCVHLAGITLAPGDSAKCSFTLRAYSPPAEHPITNTAEVCVEMTGDLHATVGDPRATACDRDPSRVRSVEVLGQTVTPPPTRTPPGGTAFTGPDDGTVELGLLALGLLLLGAGVLFAGYRRRHGFEG